MTWWLMDSMRVSVNLNPLVQFLPKNIFPSSIQTAERDRVLVADFYSIAAGRYMHGGDVTFNHFCFLFNTILGNIELAGTPQLNAAHAVILHKGPNKDRCLDSSYRTILSCSFLANCIDTYLGDLSKETWKSCQAPTQYQGEGMSHELAALLLTCSVQNSLGAL